MLKRKKDDGFTLIELMIVIAVIGILAVVLVPKVGGIKTTAKLSGVDVNMNTAQAYVQGRINHWATSYDQTAIVTEINSNVTDTQNPLDTTKKGVVAVTDLPDPVVNGTVYVVIPATSGGIVISGYDNSGKVYNTATITP